MVRYNLFSTALASPVLKCPKRWSFHHFHRETIPQAHRSLFLGNFCLIFSQDQGNAGHLFCRSRTASPLQSPSEVQSPLLSWLSRQIFCCERKDKHSSLEMFLTSLATSKVVGYYDTLPFGVKNLSRRLRKIITFLPSKPC